MRMSSGVSQRLPCSQLMLMYLLPDSTRVIIVFSPRFRSENFLRFGGLYSCVCNKKLPPPALRRSCAPSNSSVQSRACFRRLRTDLEA